MPADIQVTNSSSPLERHLAASFGQLKPHAVGVASAFVSVYGVQWLKRVAGRANSSRCRLLAGTDSSITHPEAVRLAISAGWQVRFASAAPAIFHPKLIVAGSKFDVRGVIRTPSLIYVGSANLTRGGLLSNTECGIASGNQELSGGPEAFGALWRAGTVVDERTLNDYSVVFAESNRRRTARQIVEAGVADEEDVSRVEKSYLKTRKPPTHSSVSYKFARAAWTGLQSFTGEYTFQVEFPRAAGEVIRKLIRARTNASGPIEVFCEDDGRTRPMRFAFYEDNSMFRLNIPNDVANVTPARRRHEGIALVTQGPPGGASLSLRIFTSGTEMDEIVRKSLALGTWGRTPTRLYGWF